jgi:flagellar protein FlaF
MSNEHHGAVSAYDQTNKQSLGSPQEIEARALLKSADQMQLVKDNWDNKNAEQLDDALTTNRKLWTIFVGEMEKEDTGLPIEIRNNIANLGIYTFKRTLEVISEPAPEKLDILININRNIAAGLLQNAKNYADSSSSGQQPTPPAQNAQPQATPSPYPNQAQTHNPAPNTTPPSSDSNDETSGPTSFDV